MLPPLPVSTPDQLADKILFTVMSAEISPESERDALQYAVPASFISKLIMMDVLATVGLAICSRLKDGGASSRVLCTENLSLKLRTSANTTLLGPLGWTKPTEFTMALPASMRQSSSAKQKILYGDW
jgi:hypothetical protein